MDRPRKQNESAEEGAIKAGGNQGGRVENKGKDSSGGRGGGPNPDPGVRLGWMNPFQQLIDSGQFDDYLRGEHQEAFRVWGGPGLRGFWRIFLDCEILRVESVLIELHYSS